MNPDLEIDPRLAEEAVRLALRESPLRTTFDREREKAYLEPDPERRETAFQEIHARWFARLDLGAPVRTVLREAGSGLSKVSRWLLVRAIGERQSAAELFVAQGRSRSVVVKILPATLVHPERALAFLRRELLHVADMLDAGFEYEPRLPRSPLGPPGDRKVQDRYAALWRASVEGRLVSAGKLPGERRAACLAGFQKVFGCLGEDGGACFERIWSGDRPLHSVLVALATDPVEAFGVRRAGSREMRRCPLCGFPTGDPDPGAARLPCRAREEIRRDFPSWSPRQGLCRQCADLYRSLPADRPACATPG